MSKKRILGAALVIGPVIVGGVAVASPAWAAQEQPAACALYASNVTQSGNTLSGDGGRQGCGPGNVNVAAAIYKDVSFLPDPREASAERQNVTNVNIHLIAACDGTDPYYVLTNSSTGNSFEGSHTNHC